MADYTVEIDLPDHKRGDKWPGLSIGPVLIDGAQPDEVLTRVRMHFVARDGVTKFVMDSDAGGDVLFSITNAVTWEARVLPILDFLSLSGNWKWDTEVFKGAETSPLTIYKGVLTVHEDITKN